MRGVFSGREQESLLAKARWFRSLTLEERMDYLCEITYLILENQPDLARKKPIPQWAKRVQVLQLPEESGS